MVKEYDAHGPLDAQVRLGAGSVQVAQSPYGTATVSVEPADRDHEPSARLAASAEISFDGDVLSVRVPEQGRIFRRGEVVVRLGLPTSSSLAVKAGAAGIVVRDGLVSLEAKVGAGDVDIDQVDELAVKAGQTDVKVGRAGSVTVSTGMGSLRAERVGDAAFKTGHGQVELGATDGNVLVKGGAVQLVLREAASGEVHFDTGSGSATVGVVPGTTVQLDMTSGAGDVRCELPLESSAPAGGAGLRVRLRTGSGDLLVASAAPADAGAHDPVG